MSISEKLHSGRAVLYCGDCLDIMPLIPAGSIDMILCDLPYGTTACKWDEIISFDKLWEQYSRLIKPRGAILLNCAQPFTAKLIVSKIEWFRHEWIWDKVRPSGMQIAKYRPMQRHESVCVFGKESVNYYPIMVKRTEAVTGAVASRSDSSPLAHSDGEERQYLYKFPQSILDDDIGKAAGIIDFCKPTRAVHSTQKPVPMLSYLLQTYSKQGDVVLDNTMGSGSTGVACINESRDFIGVEKDETIFALAKSRIESAKPSHYVFGVNADDSTKSTIVAENQSVIGFPEATEEELTECENKRKKEEEEYAARAPERARVATEKAAAEKAAAELRAKAEAIEACPLFG